MKRIVFLGFVFLMILSVSTFAQEKKGYIKPTFGLGFGLASQDNDSINGMALSFDVDFVSSIGLTFGIQDLFLFNSDLGYNLIPFGGGYTYSAEKWSVGGKIMAVPTSSIDGGIGFDVNGTYWINQFIGVTGIMDLYFGMAGNGGTVFSTRIGASTKF
jgi:hypothetical protein